MTDDSPFTVEGWDEICKEIGGPETDKRMCMLVKGHEGPHGWEIPAEMSALANEIQMETGCPEEVAVVTAQYAHQQIEGWKRVAEEAWRKGMIAEGVAVEMHQHLVAIIEQYDNAMPDWASSSIEEARDYFEANAGSDEQE